MAKRQQFDDTAKARLTALIREGMQTALDNGEQWHAGYIASNSGMAYSLNTGKPYLNSNQLYMMLFYGGGPCATYKGWQNVGAQVKQGEKSTTLVHVGSAKKRELDKNGNEQFYTKFSYFNTFHHSQVEGYEYTPEQINNDFVPIEAAQKIIDNSGANISHGANGAWFNSKSDSISAPFQSDFETPELYYGTMFHELIHWTGAEHRLDRPNVATYFDDIKNRAREELTAELGASFLSAHVGIETTPAPNHAQYLNAWIKALDDNNEIFAAANDAQASVNYILELGN
jgi:antirestriction protein ArdC